MSNELKQDGSFNIGIQNVGDNSNVEITQILAKSYEYNDLLDRLKTKQKLLERTPENESEERQQIIGEINQIKETFEQFKRDVTTLAETFNKIEINTERLKRAKEFFEKGDFGESRAVLECELEQMRDEQKLLLRREVEYQTVILPKLVNNADEFLILALSTRTNYDNPDWLSNTCNYFECSIKSYANKDNIFQYAIFLQQHCQFAQAIKYYNLYLKYFKKELNDFEYANTLNNLALVEAQNEYEEALKEQENSTHLRSRLSHSINLFAKDEN